MKLRKIPISTTIKVLMSAKPRPWVGLIVVDPQSAGSPQITHQVLDNLIRHGQATKAHENGRNAVFLTQAGMLFFNQHRQEVEQATRKKIEVKNRTVGAAELVDAYGSEWAIELLAKCFANNTVAVAKSGLMPRIRHAHVKSYLKKGLCKPSNMLAVASAWIGAGLVRNPDGFNAPLRQDMDFFLTKRGQQSVDEYVEARKRKRPPLSTVPAPPSMSHMEHSKLPA